MNRSLLRIEWHGRQSNPGQKKVQPVSRVRKFEREIWLPGRSRNTSSTRLYSPNKIESIDRCFTLSRVVEDAPDIRRMGCNH